MPSAAPSDGITLKALSRWSLATCFALAGIAHFTLTEAFAAIVPPMLPAPHAIVRITGAMELAFAAALLTQRQRKLTGRLLALYLLAVLPANVTMALERIPIAGWTAADWLAWLRVALQFPLIALVLWATDDQRIGWRSRSR